MGNLVRIVVGEWERVGPGVLRFNRDFTRPAHDIVIRESDAHMTVVEMIRENYKLSKLIQPLVSVLLTYEFPYIGRERGDYTSPPIEIKTERDFVDFMSMRIDVAWVELYREAVLREICTPEELEVLRRASRILAEEVTDDNETGENCSESTDGSSALPITIAMPRTEGRVTGERELLL
ncbi:hypothetical protein Bca4012_064078 [Brassica carinata]|uniref:Uncharacterized protein n=1 Tax=Brassica carinata TaxID=52824 RepID=A0A8X7SFD6_BRACI|nr:hypothetical protein Bca52824_033658 [Brassica carinata]